MLTKSAQRKRRLLEQQLSSLKEEYQAASDQIGFVLDYVQKVRIERQLSYLEEQINRVEKELQDSGRISVEAHIEGNNHVSYSQVERNSMFAALLSLLGAPGESIDWYRTTDDGTLVSLTLALSDADRLTDLLCANDARLQRLSIDRIDLASMSGENEQWLHKDHRWQTPLEKNHRNRSRPSGVPAPRKGANASGRSVTDQPIPSSPDQGREILLQRVKERWIDGFLTQLMGESSAMQVQLKESSDAITDPWDTLAGSAEHHERELTSGTALSDIIIKSSRRSLLILGDAGSGKTTQLLMLARDAIAWASESQLRPVPVILNLSSWKPTEGELAFALWLVNELNCRYYIPGEIAAQWLDEDRLVLLLDGLDEVPPEYRESCVSGINEFRHMRGFARLVVCCRTQDYSELNGRLELDTAIILQPLRAEAVTAYLAQAGERLAGVRTALVHDAPLQKLTTSPLTLHIMSIAYADKTPADLSFFESVEQRRAHLFNTYIACMFNRVARTRNEQFAKEETVSRLSWLARSLHREGLSEFWIDQIQPDWLIDQGERRLYTLAHKTFAGLFAAIISAIIAGATVSIGYSWQFGLSAAVVTGLIAGAIGSDLLEDGFVQPILGKLGHQPEIQTDRIEMMGELAWRWKDTKATWITVTVAALMLAFAAIVFDLQSGIISGLVSLLVGGFLSGLREVPWSIQWDDPNPRFKSSLRNATRIGLAVWAGVFTFIELFLKPLLSLEPISVSTGFGLVFGFSAGLSFGGKSCIQHTALRLILAYKNHLPWRYRRFLDFAAERIFLVKVAGGYAFRHRLLADHFSGLSDARKATARRSAYSQKSGEADPRMLQDTRIWGLLSLVAGTLVLIVFGLIAVGEGNPRWSIVGLGYVLPLFVGFILSRVTLSVPLLVYNLVMVAWYALLIGFASDWRMLLAVFGLIGYRLPLTMLKQVSYHRQQAKEWALRENGLDPIVWSVSPLVPKWLEQARAAASLFGIVGACLGLILILVTLLLFRPVWTEANGPFLGVKYQDMTDESAKPVGAGTVPSHGVLVTAILEGSAAQTAGIQKDDIILSVNVTGISEQVPRSLTKLLSSYAVGDPVSLTILREGREVQSEVILRRRSFQQQLDLFLIRSRDFLVFPALMSLCAIGLALSSGGVALQNHRRNLTWIGIALNGVLIVAWIGTQIVGLIM